MRIKKLGRWSRKIPEKDNIRERCKTVIPDLHGIKGWTREEGSVRALKCATVKGPFVIRYLLSRHTWQWIMIWRILITGKTFELWTEPLAFRKIECDKRSDVTSREARILLSGGYQIKKMHIQSTGRQRVNGKRSFMRLLRGGKEVIQTKSLFF